jgi:hypothetical protein
MKLFRVSLRCTALLAVGMWLLIGCMAGANVGPVATLHDYAAALREKDAPRAYGLLSSDAKRNLTFAAFEQMLRDDPAGTAELAASIESAVQPIDITAQVTASNGEVLALVYENGTWKADLAAIDLYSQATPGKTVRSFVRAFDARRYDLLIRFVPAAELEGLTPKLLQAAWEGPQREEMTRLVGALRASPISATTEVLGNRATVAYGAGASIQLINEAGYWKIEEF